MQWNRQETADDEREPWGKKQDWTARLVMWTEPDVHVSHSSCQTTFCRLVSPVSRFPLLAGVFSRRSSFPSVSISFISAACSSLWPPSVTADCLVSPTSSLDGLSDTCQQVQTAAFTSKSVFSESLQNNRRYMPINCTLFRMQQGITSSSNSKISSQVQSRCQFNGIEWREDG